jgi:hypothetical protein|nr:MAG TPA: hypothetical protein [Bacteriophage sp.]
MLSSISNNKTISKEGEVWLDAILKRDISKVSKDNIDAFRMFNKSKLTNSSVVRKSVKETLVQKVSSGIVQEVYCKTYDVGDTHYIAYLFSSKGNTEYLRAVVQESDEDTIAKLVDEFKSGKNIPNKAINVDSLRGCNCVANTYYNSVTFEFFDNVDDFISEMFNTFISVVFIAFDSLDIDVLKKVITISEPFIYLDDMDYSVELNFVSTDKTVLPKVYELLSDICGSKYLVKSSHYIGLHWEF